MENLGLSALRTDDLREFLRQCKASQKLLVLDCCHAGGEKGESVAGSSSQELGASFRSAEGLVTLASCRKQETSREWEAKGHGLFTYFLAEGLTGKADADGNGVVDSDELYSYVFQKVQLTSQRELNARQTPVRIIGEDVVGRFALAWLMSEKRLVPPDARGPRTQRDSEPRLYALLVGIAGNPAWSAGWSPDGKSIAWGNTSKFTSWNDRGPLERSFSLADLEIGPSPDASYRRARESRGSLSLELTELTSLGVKQQDAVVAKIAPPYCRELIRSFSFVTDDRVAVGADNGAYLFDARTGTMIREFRGHTSVVCAVAPSPDGRYLLSASYDQIVRIWDPDRDEPLLSLFVAGDDWIAWTPEGYYAASPGGENLMGWQICNGPGQVGTFGAASRFHKTFYRPDVIKLALKTGSVATALERLNKLLKAVKEVLPPLVVITSPDRTGVRLDAPELTVRATAVGQPGHPVTALRLLLDGRPHDGDQGRMKVPNDAAGGRQKHESWQVRLDPGRHRLAVVAESDVSNGQSDEIEVLYNEKLAERPRLYIVAIGVSRYPGPLRLQYAADDARAVESVFRAKSGPLFESIEIRAVVDEDATRRNIIGKLNWLRQTMRVQDVGLFFFSGHGDFRDNSFYMLSVDADMNDLESTAVPAAQLKSILATTKGKLVVLLDACHSRAQAAMLLPRTPIRRIEWSQPIIPVGRLRSPESLLTKFRLLGSQQEGEKQLRPSTDELVRALSNDEHGVITMSSSTGYEVSVESAEWKHGYFTEALTEGLSGKADLNNDGLVYLRELDAYVVNRVKDLSNDSQHPTTAWPPGVRSFPLSRSRP